MRPRLGARARRAGRHVGNEEDVEALWEAILDRKIDWIVSDHACCSAEQKWSKDDPDNIWLAKSGFGGTEYLLSGVMSEGSKRGLSYNRMAELLSWTPSRRFGLLNKGDIVWSVPHGETPDNVRNNPALKGLTIPRTGRQGLISPLVTKTLVIASR